MMPQLTRRNFIAGAAYVGAGLPLAASAVGRGALRGQTSPWHLTPIADNAVYARRRPMRGGLYCEQSDKTFVSWMGRNCHPYVKAFDHGKGEWSPTRRVGTANSQGMNRWPVMVQGSDGRLHVVYSAHNTQIRHAVSPEPASIDGQWHDTTIGVTERASYPMPVRAANGDLYIFYRFTSTPTDFRPYVYIKSTDQGKSWSEPARAIWHETPHPLNLNEIYIGAVQEQRAGTYGPERFLFAWTTAGGGPGRRSHVYYAKDIYFATFRPGEDKFYSVRGDEIGPSIDAPQALEHCLVHDTGQLDPEARRATFWHAVAPSFNPATGNPVVAFGQLNGDMARKMGDGQNDWHQEVQYDGKFAIWENNAWVIRDVIRGLPIKAPEQCGPNCFRAYCGVTGITIVKSTDGGHTWHKEQELQADNAALFNVIDNHHPRIKVLLTQREVPTGGHRRPGHSPDTYDQNHQVWMLGTDPIPAPRM